MLKKPFYMFIGYRTAISSLKHKEHLGLLEKFEMNEAGELKRSFARAGLDFDANLKPELEEYVKKGLIGNEVWVTPGLPFMLSIRLPARSRSAGPATGDAPPRSPRNSSNVPTD